MNLASGLSEKKSFVVILTYKYSWNNCKIISILGVTKTLTCDQWQQWNFGNFNHFTVHLE